MFRMIRKLSVRDGLLVEGPAFLVSFLTAELFYKFHSFTLECLAFLATWVLVSAAAEGLAGLLDRRQSKTTNAAG